jgi:hypothetical protein
MAVSPLVASAITVPSSVPPPIPTIVPAIVATVVTEPEVHFHGGTGVSRVAPVSVVWVIGAVGRPIYGASP